MEKINAKTREKMLRIEKKIAVFHKIYIENIFETFFSPIVDPIKIYVQEFENSSFIAAP